MSSKAKKPRQQPFIVDNADEDWKFLQYLHEWCAIAEAIDIATGYFEIGGLLGLKDEWQEVDNIRILMGDEVSRPTKKVIEEAFAQKKQQLDDSIERLVMRERKRVALCRELVVQHSRAYVKRSQLQQGAEAVSFPVREAPTVAEYSVTKTYGKLKALVRLLKSDKVLKKHKVLVFTEFADTARYLQAQLVDRGIEGVDRVDGSTKDRGAIIRRFAPYDNGFSSAELADQGKREIRVLVSTDVLSEGLNLQDGTRMINYDLHWDPVRVMQRIGRVDRRMNPQVEERLVADRLNALPGRVFSGKEHPSPAAKAVFFCYRIPRPDHANPEPDGSLPWTEEAGETKWYLYDMAADAVLEDPTGIVDVIRCEPDTPRHCVVEQKTLSQIRSQDRQADQELVPQARASARRRQAGPQGVDGTLLRDTSRTPPAQRRRTASDPQSQEEDPPRCEAAQAYSLGFQPEEKDTPPQQPVRSERAEATGEPMPRRVPAPLQGAS